MARITVGSESVIIHINNVAHTPLREHSLSIDLKQKCRDQDKIRVLEAPHRLITPAVIPTDSSCHSYRLQLSFLPTPSLIPTDFSSLNPWCRLPALIFLSANPRYSPPRGISLTSSAALEKQKQTQSRSARSDGLWLPVMVGRLLVIDGWSSALAVVASTKCPPQSGVTALQNWACHRVRPSGHHNYRKFACPPAAVLQPFSWQLSFGSDCWW